LDFNYDILLKHHAVKNSEEKIIESLTSNYGRNNGRRAFPSVSGSCILLLESCGILLLIQQKFVNKDQIQKVVN